MNDERLPFVHPVSAEKADSMAGGLCRICLSPFIAYVRHIPMRRMRLRNALYYCMSCESFQLPWVYSEPEDQLIRDAEWHLGVEERNEGWARRFFAKIVSLYPEVDSVLEIGCGTGTLLSVAEGYGFRAKGFDTNVHATELGRCRHGVDLESSHWTSRGFEDRFSLVVCISILEHLASPRDLVEDLAIYSRRTGAWVYISVPFATERDSWYALLEPDPTPPDNPFYLSDVHINHFSHAGFRRMMTDFEAVELEYFPYGWMGYLARF